MGNLFQEVHNEQQHKRTTQIDVILEQLTGEDRNDFIELLNDENVSASALSRVMQRRGFSLHRHCISEYRNKPFRHKQEGKTK